MITQEPGMPLPCLPCAIKAKYGVMPYVEMTRKSSAESLSILSGPCLEKWTPNGSV